MRIALLGTLFPDSFTRNIQVTLEAMGHEVACVSNWRLSSPWPYPVRVAVNQAAQRGWIGGARRRLHRCLRDFRPELVLNAYWDVPPELVAEARSLATGPVVAWFPDHPVNLNRQYLLAAPYDALFFKIRGLVDSLRQQLDKPAFYLPECCNPGWHRRVELTPAEQAFYGCDLTTAGNLYYYRAQLLEPLAARYRMKIWGSGCPPWLSSPVRGCYQNHFVAELEKAKAFNAATIVLNTLHPAEIGSANARLFEAAGCGAFQIAEHRECLAEYFEPDAEVVTFRSRPELLQKIEYYLAHDQERQRVADRAYERAHREHTYKQRLQQLLSTLAALPGGTAGP